MKTLLKRNRVIQFTAAVFILVGSLSNGDAVRAGSNGIDMPAGRTRHNIGQYDTSFAIPVKSALYKLKQNQSVTLIDIGSGQDFERLRIPGSMNIPLHFIKTKPFLKGSPIVIINKGFGYSRLISECRHLKALGFNISILDGGLPTWHQKGGFLVGDLLALNDMKTISPREFFPESRFQNVLLIDVSPDRTTESIRILPHAIHLPNLIDSPSSQNSLQVMIKARRNQTFQSVLVVNSTGEGYAEVKRMLDRKRINAFYLQGGLSAYGHYLENLALSWKSRESRTRTFSNCKLCGEKSEAETFQPGE
jgi:rhodanese-related sulfurtransferase